MTVRDALPMDIYVDPQGKLWRCVGICSEPTVIFEEVEGHTPEPPGQWAVAGIAAGGLQTPQRVPIIKDRKSGGVGGLIWDGWQRIFRTEPKS